MSDAVIWTVILGLGAATYAIRFSFLGLLAGRSLPPLAMRALRFVPVTVLPALVAPMILMPEGTLVLDPPRVVAATACLVLGATTRNVFLAILSAMLVYAGMRAAGA
ncbi:MAG: AzlD domain-containing protein [Pseudomonadota bacterium]